MTYQNKRKTPKSTSTMATRVGANAARKLRAQRNAKQRVWFGLGMMGLIGWSIAVPTLLGAVLGVYIDQTYNSERSWTLALLIAGLTIGCLNAWHWIAKEEQAIRDEQKKDAEDE